MAMITSNSQSLTHGAKRHFWLFQLILGGARKSQHIENGTRQWIVSRSEQCSGYDAGWAPSCRRLLLQEHLQARHSD